MSSVWWILAIISFPYFYSTEYYDNKLCLIKLNEMVPVVEEIVVIISCLGFHESVFINM